MTSQTASEAIVEKGGPNELSLEEKRHAAGSDPGQALP